MKAEDDGFFVSILKIHKGTRKVGLSLFCCAFALVCFAQTVLGAGVSTTIIDADGDIATVQLSGSGTLTVSLVNPSNGPIDHIALFNTDGSSSLTIKVKKSAAGDGAINVNAISGNGSLKSLSAKSANIVGSGINLGGFIGALTIKNLANSALTLQGNGVPSGGIALGSYSGGAVSDSQIQISGSVGKFSAAQMLNSHLWAGYSPGVSTNPMAGGTFVNGYRIMSVSLKGTKGSVASAFVNSTIAAQSIGSVSLTSANTSNNGTPFGILADSGVKSVSIKQPKFKWNLKGHITQTLNDFQVRRLAEVIIASHTRVLTAADLSGLVISNSVYTFSATAPSLQGVQVGDVLVSSGGAGFLVKVLSVTSGGGSLVLQTAPGTLTDAIQKAAFDQTIPFVPTTLLYLAPGVTVTTNNVTATRLARASATTAAPLASLGQFTFNYTFNNVELAPNVDLTGSANLTVTPNVNAQIAFPFDLQSFSASVDADMTANVDVFVGASLSAEQKVLLVQYEGAPFVITAGPLPIVVVPTLNLYAGVKADADAGIDFSATIDGSYTAGAAWQKTGGWQNLGVSSLQFATTLANPTMGGSVRGYLRPEITLALYGLSGPDIYGEGGIALAGSVNSAKRQFCWSLTGDLDAGVGIDLLTIGSVDLSYQAQVLSYDHQFAGTCHSISSGSAPSVTTGAASAVSSNSATLNGTVNPNGLATTAHFEWGTSTSYGHSTTAQSVGSGTTSTSVNFGLTGLSANTPYHFRLVASNSAGTTNGSDHSFTTASGPSGGGSAPTVTTTAASTVTSNSATLNGTVNPNGLASTTYFEWGTNASYGSTTTSQSAGSGASGVSVNAGLTGLTPNTTYHFQLVASNSAGGNSGGDQSFTTASASSGSAPTVVTLPASGVTSNAATLNGTVNPNGLATTAYFEWGASTNYGNATSSQVVGSSSNNIVVNTALTGLITNTNYHFRLVASNTAGTRQGVDQTFSTDLSWAKSYGGSVGSGRSRWASVAKTPDGGYLASGYTTSFGAGDEDAWVVKLKSDGSVAWQKTYGGTNYDWVDSVALTSDGGYVLAGSTYSFGMSGGAWVLKLTDDGSTAWQKEYFDTNYVHEGFYPSCVAPTPDGGYIVAASMDSPGAYAPDTIWALKLNGDGSVAWQKSYGGSYEESVSSVAPASDGGYFVGGYRYSLESHDWETVILKLNNDGSIAWQKSYGGPGDGNGATYDAFAYSMVPTLDGGCIIAGDFSIYYTKAGVLKLNSDGSIAWQINYDTGSYTDARSVTPTSDGGYIVAGNAMFSGADYTWVLKLGGDGTIAWQKAYSGGSGVSSVTATTDGGYVVAGTYEIDTYTSWVRLLKLNGDGSINFNPSSGWSVMNTDYTTTDLPLTITDPTLTATSTSASVLDTTAIVSDTDCIITQQAP